MLCSCPVHVQYNVTCLLINCNQYRAVPLRAMQCKKIVHYNRVDWQSSGEKPIAVQWHCSGVECWQKGSKGAGTQAGKGGGVVQCPTRYLYIDNIVDVTQLHCILAAADLYIPSWFIKVRSRMSVKWRGRVLSILSDKFLRIFHLNTDEKEIFSKLRCVGILQLI